MRILVVHHHFRPGGVRRVIEQTVACVARGKAEEVLLLGGEPPPADWFEVCVQRFAPARVSCVTDPSLGYSAETGMSGPEIRRRVRKALAPVLNAGRAEKDWLWIHNPGLGRNAAMMVEIARMCRARGIRVVWHHHDWWFDNRWSRWGDMRRLGVSSLGAAARATMPSGTGWLHAGINRADVRRLRAGFGKRAAWLPNPVELPRRRALPSQRSVRDWLEARHGIDRRHPLWLLPCRFLRRKNVAEAILLARWLRPDAFLVTTAGASSEDERPAWNRIRAAADEAGWRVRLSVLADGGAGAPSVEALLGACEAVVLSSVQEGFGLPLLEAVAAGKPLIGRRLAHIVPDLEHLGFRFPTLYDEVLVSRSWLDWPQEVMRQDRLFEAWRRRLPRPLRSRSTPPAWLHADDPGPVPFARLTLTGQMEVLAVPPDRSRDQAFRLNPWLSKWAGRASRGALPRAHGDQRALERLSGRAYARRFWRAWAEASPEGGSGKPGAGDSGPPAEQRVLDTFLRDTLSGAQWYPILWSAQT